MTREFSKRPQNTVVRPASTWFNYIDRLEEWATKADTEIDRLHTELEAELLARKASERFRKEDAAAFIKREIQLQAENVELRKFIDDVKLSAVLYEEYETVGKIKRYQDRTTGR